MDELFVNPQKILHLHLRRRSLRRVSRTCGASAGVFRQRRLLESRGALGWSVLGALLTAVGAGFAGSARWGSFLPHYRPGVASKTPAPRRVRVRGRRV
jgi:hypothetical protein